MTALKGKGKAAVKIGMQCGKLITDSRFYKPPKWKRKASFRAIASAFRESAVCMHRSFATWKWVDGLLDGTNLQIDRGVARLDGARGKIQAWRSRFWTWRSSGSEYTVLKNVRVTLLGIFGALAIIWRPCTISAPPKWFGAGKLRPLAPSLRPCRLNHNAACKKLQIFTLANNLPLCDKNALNGLD